MVAKKKAKGNTAAETKSPDFHCPIISVRDKAAPRQAARVMACGGVVAYPTETSYALGCSGIDKNAVARVYAIKGRDKSKPLPLIMADAKMASRFTAPTPSQKRLVGKFMPGPLTIAAKKTAAIPASGKAKTVAFRIPASEFARKASAILGAPIVSTSANISGGAAVYEIARVVELFAKKADLIVDAGDLPQVPASTVVCLLGAPKILREGPISGGDVLAELSGKPGRKKKTRKKKTRAKGRRK